MTTPTQLDPAPPCAELPPGATLHGGRFVVRRVLGRGGFGITYATDDRRLDREVAVKELFPDFVVRHDGGVAAPPHAAPGFADAKARFLREAAVLSRFNHPSIVRVFEVFEERGTAYLVMELLGGRTLAQALAARRLPLAENEALDITARCAGALAVVHEAGVLHRDLNPSNVMVAPGGRVVLIDFGLAREFAADTTRNMTRLVTPGYAPPEQYLGEGRFGPPTDVYALSATTYRMLTGRAPVPALDRQHGSPLPAPCRLNRAVSRLVSDGILDGLELHAEHRPRTMEDFVARLGLAGPAVATQRVRTKVAAPAPGPSPPPPLPSAPPHPPPPPPVRAPGWWAAATPALIAGAALGAASPVIVPALLALVVAPAVATAGDGIVFARLRRHGHRLRWTQRVALPPFLVGRHVRNTAAVLLAAVPALLVAGVAVAVALMLDGAGVSSDGWGWVLRLGGAAAALMVTVPVFRDRRRFRAAVVGECALRRLVDGAGQLTTAGLSAWLVAGLLALVALGLRPDLWPLR